MFGKVLEELFELDRRASFCLYGSWIIKGSFLFFSPSFEGSLPSFLAMLCVRVHMGKSHCVCMHAFGWSLKDMWGKLNLSAMCKVNENPLSRAGRK